MGPHQEATGEAIDRLAFLAGTHPREALTGRRTGLWNHRLLADAIPPFRDNERAKHAL
jgi:hypothetical protein